MGWTDLGARPIEEPEQVATGEELVELLAAEIRADPEATLDALASRARLTYDCAYRHIDEAMRRAEAMRVEDEE